jgi:hypothetical protein
MNEQTTQSPAAPTQPRSRHSVLWASAFVLFAMVLIQSQPLFAQPFGDHAARAGMVSQVGQLTVMTADAGGDDVLLVLEGRSEELFVYRTDRNGIQLQQRMQVPKLFQDAKALSTGH